MDVRLVPIGRIKRYPGNPRKNAAAVSKVAELIREFGWRQPIVCDAKGVIVVGDTRYLAAQQLGETKVPVHYAKTLTDQQARAFRIAENRSHEEAAWDDDLLVAELEKLADADFDLTLTGFEDLELADLLAEGPPIALADPDETPAPEPDEPVSQPGDMWLLGGHRLICGDSTSRGTVGRVLGKDVPRLMVTDPPYGVDYDPSWRSAVNGGGKVASGLVANDHQADWRHAWALFPGAVAYVWHGGLHGAEVTASLRAVRFQIRAQIIWVKHRAAMSRGNYHWQHEPCLVAAKDPDPGELDPLLFTEEHEVAAYAVRDGETADWVGGRKQSTVWFIEHARSDTGHGTQKPVECMRRPIINNSAEGDFVYEPFSGSGTTIIAAQLTGRRCLAVELMPVYVDVAVRRWQQLTGEEAVLDGSKGKTFRAVQEARAAGPEEAAAPPKKRQRRATAKAK